MNAQSFRPDWISPPGHTIIRLLEKKNLSTQEFTSLLAEQEAYVVSLLLGEVPIKEGMPKRLAEILGGTSSFWEARELQYQAEQARLSESLASVEAKEWVAGVAPRELIKKGWLTLKSNETLFEACLRFFNVDSVSQWRERYFGSLAMAAFRKSPSLALSLGPTAAWFRRCEILAEDQELKSWCPSEFSKNLTKIRSLIRTKDPKIFFPPLKELCSSAGVAIVIEDTPRGCPASGATRFLDQNRATIMLSLRHRTDDHFWFTFFHEAGHLLLHQNRINLDLAVTSETTTSDIERDANLFSEKILIPEEHEEDFYKLNYNSRKTGKDILRFARDAKLTPGIVVGQLQFRRNLSWSRLNSYKRNFDFDQFR